MLQRQRIWGTCVADEADPSSVARLRERALALLDEHRMPATPENYAFWFAYAEGRHPEVNGAVDAITRLGKPLTEDGLAHLHEKAASRDAGGRLAQSVGREITLALDVLLDLVTRVNGNIQDFGASLEMADRKLAGDRAALDVQALTGLLLEACRLTLLRNAQIEQQLEEARRQITSLQEEVTSLSKDANTDALTGLLNRRAFDAALSRLVTQARQTGSPLSLVLGDVDGFKLFNDTHGHQLGDQVLKFMSSAIRSLAREDDVVCRHGGEEFAVLLPDTKLQAAVQFAERLRVTIHDKVITMRGSGEKLGRLSMSFGVSELARDGSREVLVRTADQRLYVSKQAGRNRVTPNADGADRSRPREGE